MPRMKLDRDEFDIDELDVEYTEGEYEDYDGEIPPTGTLLLGQIKKGWWTYSQNDNAMIKALFIAADNEGDLEQFNGCPVWDNVTFTPAAAFRYMPFLDAFGLTLKDVRDKLFVSADDDNVGTPIEKIGTFQPGSDNAWAMVTIKRDRYNGAWQAKVGKWLAAEEEAEEEEPEPPKARARAKAKAPATRSKRSRREPEPEEEEPEEPDDEELEEDEEEERPRARTRTRTAAARKAPARKAPARRGRAKASDNGEDDEPPF